jgi:hypothetical protein
MLRQLSCNASVYARDIPAVAKLKPWPDPIGGFKLRTYPLAEERAGNALGRIYRCTNLMLNVLEPFSGPRDNAALTPHFHEDFEQGSLTLVGAYEHCLRTPWGPDRSRWKPDQIVGCGSPSLTVIPAGMIHTTVWHEGGTDDRHLRGPARGLLREARLGAQCRGISCTRRSSTLTGWHPQYLPMRSNGVANPRAIVPV